MGQTSKIEWTDATWNPVRGCSRISPGCINCYAEKIAARFSGAGETDQSGEVILSAGPFHTFAGRTPSGPRWTGKVEPVQDHLLDPLHWRLPRRVFVNSMSDLFHENLSFEAIDQIFTAMVAAPQHTYQILTKRSGRMLEYFRSGRHDNGHGPDRANYHLDQQIWLGVSVENQEYAEARIPRLLQTPASVRFISYEPALGPLSFRWATWGDYQRKPPGRTMRHLDGMRGIDWVIVGGESGPSARAFDTQWAQDVVEQCKEAGVACFVKQLGAHVIQGGERRIKKDKKGGDMDEWPHEIRVRQFPEVPHA